MRLPRFKPRYIPFLTTFRVFQNSKVDVAKSAKIIRSKIVVSTGAAIKIGEHVTINNAEIYVEKGSLSISDFSIIGTSDTPTRIIINNGVVSIGHHSKIACDRIWCRFGGRLTIGDYTNINHHSEIRCDECVMIGSYCQVSYGVRVWDTNTHCIIDYQQRRKITELHYPYFGYESTKPSTRPVTIGDDCWLGERSAILKGSNLGDRSIVGFNTSVLGKTIPPDSLVVQDVKLKIIAHNGK